MLDEEKRQLFFLAKQAQLTRNEAVDIIMANVYPTAFYGAFIRVLLEMQDHREDYIIARIGAVRTGEVYGGFSTNPSISTDKYLELILPQNLASINGILYQLNSISNSVMTEAEFFRWLQIVQLGDGAAAGSVGHENSNTTTAVASLPTQRELAAVAERIRALVNSVERCAGGYNNRPQAIKQPDNLRSSFLCLPQFPHGVGVAVAQDLAAVSPLSGRGGGGGNICGGGLPANSPLRAAGIASLVGGGGGPHGRGGNNRNNGNDGFFPAGCSGENNNNNSNTSQHDDIFVPRVASPQQPDVPAPQPTGLFAGMFDISALERDLDLPTRRQIRQDIINKMNQHNVVFPKNISELKLSQLRLVERDMIEYLIQLRDVISSKQENCVVCMDHLPTVISLPCRHKVLCRLCAPSVNTCPVCRSHLFELFEPKEV